MAKIGLIQVDNDMDRSVKARQDALIELGTKCLEDGADLIYFPEAFQYVFHREIVFDVEELNKVSREWQERCAALARKYHAYVIPWDYYADENGKVYNSSYILDREGNFVGRYCKCNLTETELARGLERGNDYPVFDLDIGRIGIMICFDNYFPEVAASLGNKGAQLIIYPLYGDTLKPQWEMKMRTRACDHSLYVASCQIDRYHWGIAYTGLIDPEGNVVAKMDEINSHKVVDVELGKLVWSNTSAKPDFGENLREYLHRCRNYSSYTSLATEGTKPWEWEDIFFNNGDKKQ